MRRKSQYACDVLASSIVNRHDHHPFCHDQNHDDDQHPFYHDQHDDYDYQDSSLGSFEGDASRESLEGVGVETDSR